MNYFVLRPYLRLNFVELAKLKIAAKSEEK